MSHYTGEVPWPLARSSILRGLSLLGCALVALAPRRAEAFWLLNFSQAQTQEPGTAGFIGGTGGQLTEVGRPGLCSFTPFLIHAGIRLGLTPRLDVGYRLTALPMPYNAVSTTLGGELDAKLRVTPDAWAWQVAVGGGGALSELWINDVQREAWSPGAYLTVTRALSQRVDLSLNGRYVYTLFDRTTLAAGPTAVSAAGGSVGLRVGVGGGVSVRPEIGLFDFFGATIGGIPSDGWGLQYGVVLSARAF